MTLAVAPPGIVETRPIGAPTRQQMRAVLAEAGITFLELPGDGLIPQEMLYDTFYHAAAPGSELYTARLIEALCARFGSAAGLDCRPAKLEEAARPIQTWQRAGYVLPKANLALAPTAGPAPARWQMTGRQASFTVVKMSGCANRLVLAAGPSVGSLTVSIDGRSVAELALSPTAPRQAVLPLGGSAGLTTVTLARGPDRAGPASALAFARLTRESACPPSPAAAPPGAAAALGRAQQPGPPA